MAKREKSKGSSKLSNLLVLALLGLLLVGLGGYGITGFGTQVRSVGRVGETEIDAATYNSALRAQLAQLSEQSGQDISIDEAQQFGLTQAVLQQRISAAAIEEAARQAKLSVGDEEVARRIQRIDAFRGLDGSFDGEAYRNLLRRSGRTPQTFEAAIRQEAAANILQRTMLNGLQPQPVFGRTLLRYAAEARSITWAPVSVDLLETPVEAPTDAEVQAYYDEHPAAFTLPETKELTYAWLAPEMLIDEVDLSDDQLRAAYDARSAEFQRPERRMIDRLGFADLEAAEAAKAAIDAGESSFADLVTERGLTEADVELGTLSRAQLTQTEADAIFGLEDTGVTAAIESDIGPALFRVNAILSAQSTSFEDAIPALRLELAQEQAVALVDDEREPLDDLLAGGATIEELAEETPMQLGTVSWSANGAPDTDLLNDPAFQNAAAQIADGDFPELLEGTNGELFAIRLDEVTPPTLQPLAEVRDAAEQGAAAQKRQAALLEFGETLVGDLGSEGSDFANLGLQPQTASDLTRQAPAFGVPPSVGQALYELGEGEARVVSDETGVYLLRVDTVTPPNPNTDEAKAALARLNQQTVTSLADDIMNEMARAVTTNAGIELNQTAINAIHSSLR